MRALRVLVADDHPIFRQGLRELLEHEPNIEIVGEATTGSEAATLAWARSPDVVLLDTEMPGMDGIAAAEQIRSRLPSCAIVLLTMDDPGAWMVEAAQVGAAAVFAKDIQPDELRQALRRLARGERLGHEAVLEKPHVASRVLKEFRDLAKERKPETASPVALSRRELEVLELIARGSSNKEIARALKISDQTVKNHITSIMRKLGVNDRTQAVVYALRRGWIKL